MTKFQFPVSAEDGIITQKDPYTLCPTSQQSPQGCHQNSSNVCLVQHWPFLTLDDGTLFKFHPAMIWPVYIHMFLKPLNTSALPSCRPDLMSAVLASLSARSFSGMAWAVDPQKSLHPQTVYGCVPVRAVHLQTVWLYASQGGPSTDCAWLCASQGSPSTDCMAVCQSGQSIYRLCMAVCQSGRPIYRLYGCVPVRAVHLQTVYGCVPVRVTHLQTVWLCASQGDPSTDCMAVCQSGWPIYRLCMAVCQSGWPIYRLCMAVCQSGRPIYRLYGCVPVRVTHLQTVYGCVPVRVTHLQTVWLCASQGGPSTDCTWLCASQGDPCTLHLSTGSLSTWEGWQNLSVGHCGRLATALHVRPFTPWSDWRSWLCRHHSLHVQTFCPAMQWHSTGTCRCTPSMREITETKPETGVVSGTNNTTGTQSVLRFAEHRDYKINPTHVFSLVLLAIVMLIAWDLMTLSVIYQVSSENCFHV